MRNDKGTCVFPIKVWNQQTINVLLELKSERDIDMTKAFSWRKGFLFVDNIESLSMSSSLNLNEWTVKQGFYKVSNPNNGTQTNCLLLYMESIFLLTSPMNVSQNVRLLMRTDWLLKYSNETLVLKPSLFDMKFPYPAHFPNYSVGDQSFNLQWPFYKQFAQVTQTLRDTILITRLHFCEQIELRLDEYQLYYNNSVMYMYNKIARKYLFDGEFVVISAFEEGLVRICVEESGFVKQYVASCADINSFTAAVVMSVCCSLHIYRLLICC